MNKGSKCFSSAAAVGLCCVGLAFAQQTGPVIRCDQPLQAFGVVTNQEVVRHTFVLRNAGDRDLVIDSVRSGCGCTTTRLDSYRMAPGATAVLDAELNLKGRQGPQSKPIYVQSNDPRTPRLTLEMSAEVLRDVEMEPAHVSFGYVESDADAVQVVRLFSATGRPFRVAGWDSEAATFFSVVLEEKRPGSEYALSVRLTGEGRAPGANFRGRLLVKTDHPDYPQLELPVMVYQPLEILVSPQELILDGAGHVSAPVTRYLLVRSPLQKEFEVTSIGVPDAGIVAKPNRLSPTRFRIELSNIQPGRALNGKFVEIRILLKASGRTRTLSVPLLVR